MILLQTRSLYAVYKYITLKRCIVILNNLTCMGKIRAAEDCNVMAVFGWECAVPQEHAVEMSVTSGMGKRECENALTVNDLHLLILCPSIHPSLKSSGCKSQALSVLPYLTVLSSFIFSLSLSLSLSVWGFLDSDSVFVRDRWHQTLLEVRLLAIVMVVWPLNPKHKHLWSGLKSIWTLNFTWLASHKIENIKTNSHCTNYARRFIRTNFFQLVDH